MALSSRGFLCLSLLTVCVSFWVLRRLCSEALDVGRLCLCLCLCLRLCLCFFVSVSMPVPVAVPVRNPVPGVCDSGCGLTAISGRAWGTYLASNPPLQQLVLSGEAVVVS